MIDLLSRWDVWLLLKLNVGVANAFFDWLMPVATELRNWLPFIAGGLLTLAIFGGGKGRTVVLLSIVLIAVTDQLSAHFIKQFIERPRPCHDVEGIRILYRCGNTFSFPSTHAVNSMAAAVFFGLIYRRWLWPLFAVSLLVSYSRIYLGIHYPFDTLAGWVLGASMAGLAVWSYRLHVQPFMNRFRLFRVSTIASKSVE